MRNEGAKRKCDRFDEKSPYTALTHSPSREQAGNWTASRLHYRAIPRFFTKACVEIEDVVFGFLFLKRQMNA
ncbi:hypothetical protein [Coleofasciculus sp. H7-2]|uniref:hypothetical protein n=1 Tax=Coleofasciculus sp. H7-2 TaxID=3351545 RepID=UPI00366AD928